MGHYKLSNLSIVTRGLIFLVELLALLLFFYFSSKPTYAADQSLTDAPKADSTPAPTLTGAGGLKGGSGSPASTTATATPIPITAPATTTTTPTAEAPTPTTNASATPSATPAGNIPQSEPRTCPLQPGETPLGLIGNVAVFYDANPPIALGYINNAGPCVWEVHLASYRMSSMYKVQGQSLYDSTSLTVYPGQRLTLKVKVPPECRTQVDLVADKVLDLSNVNIPLYHESGRYIASAQTGGTKLCASAATPLKGLVPTDTLPSPNPSPATGATPTTSPTSPETAAPSPPSSTPAADVATTVPPTTSTPSTPPGSTNVAATQSPASSNSSKIGSDSNTPNPTNISDATSAKSVKIPRQLPTAGNGGNPDQTLSLWLLPGLLLVLGIASLSLRVVRHSKTK